MANNTKSKKSKDKKEEKLLDILKELEETKLIGSDVLIEAIESSLLQAYKNHFGRSDNCKIVRKDGDDLQFVVYSQKTVVSKVEDDLMEISLDDATIMYPEAQLGDIIDVVQNSTAFGRIATQSAKNIILQRIREEERNVLLNSYRDKEHCLVTGVVHRFLSNNNISINLGKIDAILPEKEQLPGEKLELNQRVKLYVVEVKDVNKGPRITVSRARPELVSKLFESEVPEVADGTVIIEGVAREAGLRSKMSVRSTNSQVDPVGACVGVDFARVKAVVSDINGEKIDIVSFSDNPAENIENALSPAKVISVMADTVMKEARIVVPDKQLSLAIGKEGQNARLAAKLTGYKIDIKSESQAVKDWGIFGDQSDSEAVEDLTEDFEDQLDEIADHENGEILAEELEDNINEGDDLQPAENTDDYDSQLAEEIKEHAIEEATKDFE